MELADAFLANAAEIQPDGRFFVLGGNIEVLRTPLFPFHQPTLSVVVGVRASAGECGREHHLQVTAVGPDGQAICPAFDLPFTPVIEAGPPRRIPKFGAVMTIQGVVFPVEGEYRFSLLVNGQVIGSITLYIERTAVDNPPGEEFRRKEIEKRAPSRVRLSKVIARLPDHDPWLDDEHDWNL
jgi:hypothetical protein